MNVRYFFIAGFIGLLAVLFVFAAVQNIAEAETTQDNVIAKESTCSSAYGQCAGNGCSGGTCNTENRPSSCGCK